MATKCLMFNGKPVLNNGGGLVISGELYNAEKYYKLNAAPNISESKQIIFDQYKYCTLTGTYTDANGNRCAIGHQAFSGIQTSTDGYMFFIMDTSAGVPNTIWVANSAVLAALVAYFRQQGLDIDDSHLTRQYGYITILGDIQNPQLFALDDVVCYPAGNNTFDNFVEFESWLQTFATADTNIVIPNDAEKMYYTFGYYHGLHSINIPENVTEVSWAFYECVNLQSITVSNPLITFGENTLYNCSKLKTIYFNGTISQWQAVIQRSDSNWNILSGNYVVQCLDGPTPKS